MLIPAFEKSACSDPQVEVIAVGTGQAMRIAKKGGADLLFVHDPFREEKFVAEGFGVNHRLVMHNDFVILGPAGIEPQGAWCQVFAEGAKGNAPTLAFTNEKQAYTVMDRATYITMRSKITLQVLVERDDILLNYITLIPVNPAKHPQVRYAEAMQFVEWLQGRYAQLIIRDFGKEKYGEPLFFPNSPEGKKL